MWTILSFPSFPIRHRQQSGMRILSCSRLCTAGLSRHTGVSACTFCLVNAGIFFRGRQDLWQFHSDVLQIQGEWSPPSKNKWNHLCSSLISWSFSAFEEEVKGTGESFRKCFYISKLILLLYSLAWKVWTWDLVFSNIPPFSQLYCQLSEAYGGQATVCKVIQWVSASIQTHSQHLLDSWFLASHETHTKLIGEELNTGWIK